MRRRHHLEGIACLLVLALLAGCEKQDISQTAAVDRDEPVRTTAVELTDAQLEGIVRHSYQYVAMYNVNNKFAMDPENPARTGWNGCVPDTSLKDHTMRQIARPNNDSLFIGCMLDLRKDAVILDIPAFDSSYVSLMATAYDHYVNVPLTTRLGDFRKPVKALFHSARSEGYDGEPVDGVDRVFEMSGDFVSAVFRVMPHANEPERFERIIGQMKSVELTTLAEHRGEQARPIDDVAFPPYGRTDADVFGSNLLEVMQFVFNHTTFDPDDELDQGVLSVFEPLGIAPGKVYDASTAVEIGGERLRQTARRVAEENLDLMKDPEAVARIVPFWGQPKGRTRLDGIVAFSVIGPIGLPPEEAQYPPIMTADGEPLNALHDYVIRMTRDELPPAKAFWSLTLYDLEGGFFIPNDRKKYSVGENSGMKLNEDGGIEIHVAAEKPQGVPDENWLPIKRRDEELSLNLRIYVPDLERMPSWSAPKAEKRAD